MGLIRVSKNFHQYLEELRKRCECKLNRKIGMPEASDFLLVNIKKRPYKKEESFMDI